MPCEGIYCIKGVMSMQPSEYCATGFYDFFLPLVGTLTIDDTFRKSRCHAAIFVLCFYLFWIILPKIRIRIRVQKFPAWPTF